MDKELLKTKPAADAIATNNGWIDAKTGELLVAIRNLRSRLGTDLPIKRGRGRPPKKKD